MERNFSSQAIVLQSRKTGENNRNLTLLSVDNGIIEVRSFRARSSKTAPKAYQFQEGRFFLYKNPVKNDYTLKDIFLISDHEEIRTNYDSIILASVMCEFILKTAHEEMAFSYQLLASCLDFLEDTSIDGDLVLIQFILRLIKDHGLFDNFSNCPICNRKYSDSEILSFSTSLQVPCCNNCEVLSTMILPPKARKYLTLCLNLSLEEALKIKLNDITRKRMKGFMIRWAIIVMGRTFKSLSFDLK